jgi:hypothetical protein
MKKQQQQNIIIIFYVLVLIDINTIKSIYFEIF